MSAEFNIEPRATCAERQAALVAALERMRDPQERLTWIMERARLRPGLDVDRRASAWPVPGCAVRVWFEARMEGGACRFACDSDAGVLKAVAGLMCELYDGRPPVEVREVEPDFLVGSGVWRQFSENRRRTILRMREAMREFCGGQVGQEVS